MAERPADAALALAGDHRAFVLEANISDIPAAVTVPITLAFGTRTLSKKVSQNASGRRSAEWLGRNPLRAM